jgi:hypothetical protein
MSSVRTLAVLILLLSAPLPSVAGCTADVGVEADAAQPGRPAGAACAFDMQCATHRCSADVEAGTCGECVTIEALDHDCTGPHQGCSISAVCKDGVCQSLRKVEGEACSFGPKGEDLAECDIELYCAHVGALDEPGTCVRGRLRVPGEYVSRRLPVTGGRYEAEFIGFSYGFRPQQFTRSRRS